MADMPLRLLAPSLILASCAFAQAPPATANPSTVPMALTLHDATPIRLRLARDVTFTNVRPGEMADFEIMDDLRICGVLVMAHGVRASATISEVEPKTRMGKGGKLGVNLDSLPLLNGSRVTIRATKDSPIVGHAGPSGDGAALAQNIARPAAPTLLFSYGRDELFTNGTVISVYIDGEIELDPAGFLADIAFTSNPPGALVTMYGAPVGRTPFTTRLAPGSYKAVFSTEGYRDLTQSLTVGPGHASTVHVAFGPKP
jgi:hypothetical protein